MTKCYACPGRTRGPDKIAGSNKEKSPLKRAALSGIVVFAALNTECILQHVSSKKAEKWQFLKAHILKIYNETSWVK